VTGPPNLSVSKQSELDRSYEQLLFAYIKVNAAKVTRLYKLSASISSAIFEDNGDAISETLLELDEADWQSLFAFRTFSAQRGHSSDLLINHFKEQMATDWLRKRFLYPFVYYAINNTSDLYLDNFLSYVISGGIKNKSERDALSASLQFDPHIAGAHPRIISALTADQALSRAGKGNSEEKRARDGDRCRRHQEDADGRVDLAPCDFDSRPPR
jgi:hypothetical protein